jgi:hypothetical protein
LAGDDKTTASPKKEAVETKVEFLVSPTGKFRLAYNVGETGLFPAEQAKELIELGYAKEVK